MEMLQISSAIREKENWETKSQNPEILKKWQQECQATDDMWAFISAELAYYKETAVGNIRASAVDGTWQADDLFSNELRQALLKEVAKLENVPDHAKDWHPGSNNQVLDLVHPSLYCFVAGVTSEMDTPANPPLEHVNCGKVSNKIESHSYTKSKTYQWLPADFKVDKSGKVKILSYINNLHPGKNKALYTILAKIFEGFVPMFEKVLTDAINPREPRYTVDAYDLYESEEDFNERRQRRLDQNPAKRRKVEVKDTRVMCKYGLGCYRKNPVHFQEYQHPKGMNIPGKEAEKEKEDEEEEEAEEEEDEDEEGEEDGENAEESDEDSEYYEYSEGEEIRSEDDQEADAQCNQQVEQKAKKDEEEASNNPNTNATTPVDQLRDGIRQLTMDTVYSDDSDSDWLPSDEEPEEVDEYDLYYAKRRFKLPALGDFEAPTLNKPAVSLRGRQLQVIVKLANIILTPESSVYNGGVWHVEGMENEHIVASGIYYYESENISNTLTIGNYVNDKTQISESRLAFRQAVGELDYEQSDYRGVRAMYGIENEGAANQFLGSIVTKSGRAIGFPNLYQHQVQPFKLVDPTKPGYRKILVFFLVDPSLYVQSSLFVPPQQPEWKKDMLTAYLPIFKQLPGHVMDKIVELSSPMNLETAKMHRAHLMDERKQFVYQNTEQVFERGFSLCEH